MLLSTLLLQLEELARPSKQQKKQAASKGISVDEQRAAASELWQQHEDSICPQTPDELKKICDFLHCLGEHASAERAFDRWFSSVVRHLDACGREVAQIELLQAEAEKRKEYNPTEGLRLLRQACQQLRDMPIDCVRILEKGRCAGAEPLCDYWESLLDLSAGYKDWQLCIQTQEWELWQQEKICPKSVSSLQWLQWLRCRLVFFKFGMAEKIHRSKEKSSKYRIKIIEEELLPFIFNNVSVFLGGYDCNYWMDDLVKLQPDAVPTICDAALEALQKIENLPSHELRDYQLKIDVTRMQALRKCGDIEAALAVVRQWPAADRYFFGHDFFDCLIEAKCWQEAFDFALLRSLFFYLEGSVNYDDDFSRIFDAARKFSGKLPQAAEAALSLLFFWSQVNPKFSNDLKEKNFTSLPQASWYWLEEGRGLGHPLADLLEGWQQAHEQRWNMALPLLEKSIKKISAQYLSIPADFIVKLWCARFYCLGSGAALQCSWHLPGNVKSCCLCAEQLSDSDRLCKKQGIKHNGLNVFPSGSVSRDSSALLTQYYYQSALDDLEKALSSSEKCFFDVSCYNPSCLALARQQKNTRNYQQAVDFYAKAIEGEEHWPTVLEERLDCCLHWHKMTSKAAAADELLKSAEVFWWFFIEKLSEQRAGFLPRPPTYFPAVGKALVQMNRSLEIGIWLDRMQQWHETEMRWIKECDKKEVINKKVERLRACLALLVLLSQDQPEHAKSPLRAIMPDIAETGSAELLQRAEALLIR